MRISVALGAMMFYPVRSTMAIARTAGFDAVELMLTPSIIRRGVDYYRDVADAASVEVVSVHARLHYSDVALETKIASDCESVRFAAGLDACDCVVLHYPTSRTGDLTHVRAWLDTICEQRARSRPTLRIAVENRAENYDGTMRQQLDNLDRLRIVAGEWGVDVTLDIAHAASFGMDPAIAIDAVAPKLANVHISDARTRHYRGGILNGVLRDHLIPGSGDIDLRSVADRLRFHGYTGLVTLELSPVSLRVYWPWAPARLLSGARDTLRRHGLVDGMDASTGASTQRQVR